MIDKSRWNKTYDIFIKWMLFLIGTIVCAIPTELWLVIYKFASPTGFWQKFALVGAGLFVMGSIQLVGFILWLMWIWVLIFEI